MREAAASMSEQRPQLSEQGNAGQPVHPEGSGIRQYPDYHFTFEDRHFIDKSLGATGSTRARAIIRAVTQCGEEFQDYAYTDRSGYERRARSYLNQTVTISKQSRKRDEWVGRSEIFGRVLQDLAAENHPLYQAITQAKAQFADKMNEAQAWNMVETTLIYTHWPTIKANYEAAIESLRHQQ